MSQNELLTCPFCGGTNLRKYTSQNDEAGWVSCGACGADGPRALLDPSRYPGDSFNNRENGAVNTAWNTRIESAQAVAPGGVPEAKLVSGRLPRESECSTEAANFFYAQGWNDCRVNMLAAAPASEAKGQDDLCCPACEVTGFTIPVQHTEEMSFGRVIGLEADYCTNCGEAFVVPEKALRNEVKFNHARNHKAAASSEDGGE